MWVYMCDNKYYNNWLFYTTLDTPNNNSKVYGDHDKTNLKATTLEMINYFSHH